MAAPIARPPRKAATTALAAAVVWPRYRVSRRVHVTSYTRPAKPEHA